MQLGKKSDFTWTFVALGAGAMLFALRVTSAAGNASSPCAPYLRSIVGKSGRIEVCPIFNGVWTSFLDGNKWPQGPLDEQTAARIAREMRQYDEAGLNVWVGEDFDPRVRSALRAHRALVADEARGDVAARPPPLYSIIIEEEDDIHANLDALNRAPSGELDSHVLAGIQRGRTACGVGITVRHDVRLFGRRSRHVA